VPLTEGNSDALWYRMHKERGPEDIGSFEPCGLLSRGVNSSEVQWFPIFPGREMPLVSVLADFLRAHSSSPAPKLRSQFMTAENVLYRRQMTNE